MQQTHNKLTLVHSSVRANKSNATKCYNDGIIIDKYHTHRNSSQSLARNVYVLENIIFEGIADLSRGRAKIIDAPVLIQNPIRFNRMWKASLVCHVDPCCSARVENGNGRTQQK
mmetsp:Transcript_5369/g.11801  ORF Transcript_5369/g.11801 Transcript_5369/m.11801 type:complete len:114 (-) Transcript_5369:878-1219(-)